MSFKLLSEVAACEVRLLSPQLVVSAMGSEVPVIGTMTREMWPLQES